jgi:glycine/D-amino acid oxidase-like deaminating enzyme
VRRYECIHATVPPGRLAVDTPPVALHADAPGRSMRVVPSRSGAALTICEARRGRTAEESAVELPVGAIELMPGLSPLAVSGHSCSEVCASTDASFSLEWLDDNSRVLAVGGFGTNGYALSPTVARAVAELLVDGRTEIELPAGLPVRRG